MESYSNIIFTEPQFIEKPLAWIEHMPFAFFLVEKLKPKAIVELGTHYGNSYFAFCQTIKELKLSTKAYAVDSWKGDEHAGFYGQEVFNYVNKINNEHFSYFSNLIKATFDEARQYFENDSIDLLHIDGLHTYEAVKHDFESWLPKMSDQGVVIFHDTVVKDQGFGVWKLMDELRSQYPYFQFEHGYGLGVLCVGKKVDPEFLEFVSKAGFENFTQRLFDNIGKKILLEQKNQLQQDEIKILNKSIDRSNEALEITESKNKELVRTLTLKEQQLDQLRSEQLVLKDLYENEQTERIISQNQIKNLQTLIENQLRETNHLRLIINQLTNSPSWKITAPLRYFKRKVRSGYFIFWPKIRLIQRSGLFDEKFYLEKNPDVADSGIQAVKHFLLFGGTEGRNPSEKFDSSFYLEQNPDVKASGMNPLVHYLKFGKEVARMPSLVIDIQAEKLRERPVSENKLVKTGLRIIERIKGYPNARLIRNSGYFNADYYLRMNPDVKEAGFDPAAHYLYYGWKEGRSSGYEFDTNFYINNYPDIKHAKICPLLHYLKFGKGEGRLPKPFLINEPEYVKEADISTLGPDVTTPEGLRVAVICHISDLEPLEELLSYIKNIPIPFDLYLSTIQQHAILLNEFVADNFPDTQVTLTIIPNNGTDIIPFMMVLEKHLHRYDLVCKVLFTATDSDQHQAKWRKYLLENLLGSTPIIDQIISTFEHNPNLGLVYPLPSPYLSLMGLKKRWETLSSAERFHTFGKSIFSDLEIKKISDDLKFPVGGMFWCRPKALEYLIKTLSETDSFSKEFKQIETDRAIFFDSLYDVFVKKNGFIAWTTFFPAKNIYLVKNNFPIPEQYNKRILFVAHDLSRAGAEIVLLNILNWFARHTPIKSFVLVIARGPEYGKLLTEYQKVAEVFIWEDLLHNHSESEAAKFVFENVGYVDLIYGNTVMASRLYPYLSRFNATILTHFHELEEVILNCTSFNDREEFRRSTSQFIACSAPVRDNLILSHAIHNSKIALIPDFIKTNVNLPINIYVLRQRLKLELDKTIIWGCGTIHWRKGVDIFIETAIKLWNRGGRNFVFYWIGGNYWNQEEKKWGNWSKYEKLIEKHKLTNLIKFIGEIENPRDYLVAGDIFYLPSREDPFPLVCLEAAECELPIICFEKAGGIPDFVKNDAGIVVPYLDIDAAAEAIEYLMVRKDVRERFGKNGRIKILHNYSDEVVVPEILKVCRNLMKTAPVVSIIVPVYNHERYLHKRMESILNQTFRDFEIIILDDCSQDNSLEIAESYLWHPAVSVIPGEINSGSPYHQWKKGIEMARGSIIWIAESDDYCENNFLQNLLPNFNNSAVTLTYCNSNIIDENGTISGDYVNYLEQIDVQHWNNSYHITGRQEINFGLGIKNTIPNASAVLIKRSSIKLETLEEIIKYKFCGDWYLYMNVIKDNYISYFHGKLNYHRKHKDTVTSKFSTDIIAAQLVFAEQKLVHKFVLDNFNVDEYFLRKWKSFMIGQIHSWLPGLSEAEFDKYYPYSLMINDIQNAILEKKFNN